MGGAARYLDELDRYLASVEHAQATTVLGRGRSLTVGWLAQREVVARRSELKIALNNAGFWGPGGHRVVLLRNALHFADPDELTALGYAPSRTLRAQVPVVRAAARRADVIVVPCTAMAQRVIRHAPYLARKLTVRPHPVSPPRWAGVPAPESGQILVPVLPAPYKHLDEHVQALLDATDTLNGATVTVTASADQMPGLRSHERVRFIGRQHSSDMRRYWMESQAIYFPTGLESFGYPLAEARVSGRHVVAQETEQNLEIAGPALCGFDVGDPSSLRAAVSRALSGYPAPDQTANDPSSYFSWLLGGAA